MAYTNSGKKLFISPVPVTKAITLTALEAISDWLEVGGVGSHGETGVNTNILTYDTWGDSVVEKAKGMSDAGSPEIEIARNMDDAGQDALRTAAATSFNYAFKIEGNDPKTIGGDPTIFYNVGIITGPRRPNGRNEDFDLEVYTLGLNRLESITDPT